MRQRGPLGHPGPPSAGRKSIGRLKPSITVISKKSVAPPAENSASVTGGWPLREQESAPPQSPVRHEPRLAINEQPVRPHRRSLEVPAGMLSFHLCPGLSCVPPPTGVAAGHTVKLQLLVMMITAASSMATRRRIGRR